MNAESHDVNPLHGWKQRFTPVPPSVPHARRAAGAALRAWGLDKGSAGLVLLVLSELATNAVCHGRVPGRYYEVRIAYDAEKMVGVEVSDPREGRPRLAAPAPEDESGRGLAIVDALAEAWGIRERIVGKTVWARIRL
ncbi:ATP-binding protein [Streptomyces luomodiensis]|uniref:ATP-binding protein n=1 Tax=Streptomyces luomodiensis TaxID=3026192 RepID=A0ABY9V7I7_9ACTN|nr:ATP-binding protein [Streptomyces sp. SCA4-21]WNE99618.1 ATP-binding protein [Streptomyces sp. SCA4-21]